MKVLLSATTLALGKSVAATQSSGTTNPCLDQLRLLDSDGIRSADELCPDGEFCYNLKEMSGSGNTNFACVRMTTLCDAMEVPTSLSSVFSFICEGHDESELSRLEMEDVCDIITTDTNTDDDTWSSLEDMFGLTIESCLIDLTGGASVVVPDSIPPPVKPKTITEQNIVECDESLDCKKEKGPSYVLNHATCKCVHVDEAVAHGDLLGKFHDH